MLVVCHLAHAVLDPHLKTYQNRWLTSSALAAILLRCYKLDKEITFNGENINQVTSDQNHQMLASAGIGTITFENFSANNPFPTDVSFLKNHKIINLHPNFTTPSISHSPSSSLETIYHFVDSNLRRLKSSFDVYHTTPISDQLLFFFLVLIISPQG